MTYALHPLRVMRCGKDMRQACQNAAEAACFFQGGVRGVERLCVWSAQGAGGRCATITFTQGACVAGGHVLLLFATVYSLTY